MAGNVNKLRNELSARSQDLASRGALLHELSDAAIPSVVFGRDEWGRHGNFHPASYRRICGNPQWLGRLSKVHPASRRMMLRSNWRWRELDCANSSDALLMNIFCHPNVFTSGRVQAMLGADASEPPIFGYKPRTPLFAGKKDTTEVDMKLGDLLVEAKLTESRFPPAKFTLLDRYRDLKELFDLDELSQREGFVRNYQLVRSVLAAYATGAAFCLICDARRPEIAEAWISVVRALRSPDFRSRMKLLTWQELSLALPRTLQTFLRDKYGIAADRYIHCTMRPPGQARRRKNVSPGGHGEP